MTGGAPAVVLGAGFAGLVAATELRALGHDVVVLEAGSRVGGLATTHRVGDVSFDTGAHFVTNRLATAIGVADRCDDAATYGEAVWRDGRVATYPLGLLRRPRYVASALRTRLGGGPAASAADRCRAQYGRALADDVAIPLLEAWSGLPGAELAPSVLDKIPGGVGETIGLTAARRLTGRPVAIGYCAEAPQSAQVWHVYPREGIGVLADALAAPLADAIRLDTRVDSVTVTGDRVTGVHAGGTEIRPGAVLTSLPAPALARIVEDDRIGPLARLRYRAMVFVELRVRGRNLVPEPVMWFPERTLRFFRATEAPMAMPWLAPAGETVLTVDFGCEVGDDLWDASPDALAAEAIAGLTGLIPDLASRHLATYSTRTPIAYPVFARATEDARLAVHGHGIRNLAPVGRNAEFAHLLMEDVYWRTRRTAHAIAHELGG